MARPRAICCVGKKITHEIPRNLFRERNVITRYWPVGLVSSSRIRRFASSKFKGNEFSRSISIITCSPQRTFFGFFRAVPWPLEELDTFWASSYLHPTRWCFSYFFVWPWKRNLLSYFRSNFHHEKVDLSQHGECDDSGRSSRFTPSTFYAALSLSRRLKRSLNVH